MDSNKKFYILIVFIALFVFGATMLTSNKFFFSNNLLFGATNDTNSSYIDPDEDNYFKFFRMFRQAYDILKTEYYLEEDVTAKKLLYGAIEGMMEATGDPYTTFMDPQITEEFFIDMNASFGGLGIHIDVRDEWLTVVSPIEDTPAWKAGLKPNDKIIEIEGESTFGITTMEAVSILRGDPGTAVTITISREGLDEPFEVTIVREEISLKTVKSDVIEYNDMKIGYVKIIEFSMPTYEEFYEGINSVMTQDIDAMIVDVRNNPGGLLSVVIECVDLFLDEGLIVYTRGRDSSNDDDYYASVANTIVPVDLPLVTMINQGSASASEIFGGAIQDTGRGVLVGMQSFGKGSVQKTYTFADDGSMIKYTVARYFTPAGGVINEVGLTPDVAQTIWYEDLSDDEQTAILKVQYTNFVEIFLDENPDFTAEDKTEFRRELGLQGYSMGKESLDWLIDLELNVDETAPLYDLEFDGQLQAALEVLEDYDEYKGELTYYESAE